MSKKKPSKKSQPSGFDLQPLLDTIGKLDELASWMESALAHHEKFTPDVIRAVVSDYLGKIETMNPVLLEHGDAASAERIRLGEKIEELRGRSSSIEAQIDELRLRNVIGELSDEDFSAKETEARKTVDADGLDSAEARNKEIEEGLAKAQAIQERIANATSQLESLTSAPMSEDSVNRAEAMGGQRDEWEVPLEAAPDEEEEPETSESSADSDGEDRTAGTSWEAGGASAPPSSTGEDLRATGMIQAEPDLELESAESLGDLDAQEAPPPGSGPRLAVTPPGGEEVVYPFTGDVMSLGRGRNNDIQIKNDGKISRYHCRVFLRGDEYIVEDNKSSNGTLVDGKLVTRQRLEGGEVVQLGETKARFFIQ